MGLFHDEGTRRWPVSCGSDLILPIPTGTTGEDIPVSHEGLPNRSVRLCMELARALLDPNWKYSSALRTLEELVLERLMNYGSRAPS